MSSQINIRTIEEIEAELYQSINAIFQEIKAMHPPDGLNSPRDLELVKEINMKAAIMYHLQDAVRVINPEFEIRS